MWVASYVSADYQQELKRSALPNDYATASKATVEHGDRDVLTVLVRARVRVRVRLSLSLSLSLTLALTSYGDGSESSVVAAVHHPSTGAPASGGRAPWCSLS